MNRVGIGYDVHPLVEGRKLFLGGIELAHDKGLEGHSDADVLIHALADAVLGALGAGDIGHHFPNTDERWRGVSSLVFLEQIRELLAKRGAVLENVDASVIAEAPKIAPHLDKMKAKLGAALGIPPDAGESKSDHEREARLRRARRGDRGHGRGLRDVAGCRTMSRPTFQLYNSMTRAVEPLVPLDPAGKRVSLYVCGPTIYNYGHIGNFRTYVAVDLLRRALKHFGYQVDHVMQFTDVDDKTIRGSREKKLPLKEFTAIYRKAFLEDAKTLNIEIPERTPNATDHIPAMIALIQKLIDKKCGLCFRRRLGLFPHRLVSEVRLPLPSRSAQPDLRRAREPGRVREGRRGRFRPLEKMGARPMAMSAGIRPGARAGPAGTSNVPR